MLSKSISCKFRYQLSVNLKFSLTFVHSKNNNKITTSIVVFLLIDHVLLIIKFKISINSFAVLIVIKTIDFRSSLPI